MARQLLIAGVDATTLLDRKSHRMTRRGFVGVMTYQFTVNWWKNPAIALDNEALVEFKDGGSTEFMGLLRVVSERYDVADRLFADCTAQDYTSLAGDDVVDDANGLRTTQETDKARITWLFSTYGTKSITVGADCVQLMPWFPLDSAGLPTQDFTGMTLADALNAICRLSGGQWYVDSARSLHYFAKESATAPWELSSAPNYSTLEGYEQLVLPRDTVSLRNAVYVVGKSFSQWVADEDSIDAYGRREASLKDPTVEAADQATAVGNAWLAENAWPRADGSLVVHRSGLRPGMLLHVEHAKRNIAMPMQYRDAVLRLTPKVYWRLGEATGNTLDRSGNGWDGTVTGSPTRSVVGALSKDPNKAMTFASGKYVTVAHNAGMNCADVVSWVAWVKRGSAALAGLTHKGTGTLEVRWDAANKIVAYKVGTGTAIKTSSSTCPSDNAWHHVAVVKNGATTTIYIDGTDAGGSGTNATLANSSAAYEVARDSVPNYLAGSMDEPFFVGTALTAAQVQDLWQYGVGQRASFVISQVDMTLNAVQAIYTVRFGPRPVTLAGLFSGVQATAGTALNTAVDAIEVGQDTTAPTVPTGLTLTSDTALDANGATIVRIIATLDQSAYSMTADYFGCYIEVTKDNDGGSPANPVWTQPMKLLLGEESTKVAFEGVAGNVTYWGRAYALDVNGNKSAYCTAVSVTTAKDATAPVMPSGVTAQGGFHGVAVSWDGGGEADLLCYQLRWGTDDATWPQMAETRNTVYWVPDLEVGQAYYFQIRAVDVSGNVVTSDVDPTAVDYLANPDAGYTASVNAVPTQVGAADIAANSITSAMIDAGGLTADLIKSGKIVLKPTGTTALEVQDSGGKVVGFWDPTTGVTIYGSTAGDYATFDDAYLRFYVHGNPNPVAEIGPSGIVADSLRTGTLDGGHNVVRNSSFELSSTVTALGSRTFTDSTGTPGWKSANRVTSPDNITESTTLTTAAAY